MLGTRATPKKSSTGTMTKNARLVYATGVGRICPKCERYIELCCCKKPPAQPVAAAKNDGIVRVRLGYAAEASCTAK